MFFSIALRTVVAVATVSVMTACTSPERATFFVLHSNTSVTVERLSRNLYLAEYERTIIIEKGGRPIKQLKMFPDTGGYSRANLYRLDGQTLLLRDAADSYTIDLVNQAVFKDESRREAGTFLGSFDRDGSKTWRFLPVGERPEMPTEFSGG